MSGGIIQDPNLFRVAPYKMAGQIGRDPETGAIVGLGPETFATQVVMEDLDNDGRPDFLERYSDFFDTAGGATKSGVSAIESGIGQIADAEDYFPTAKTAVQAGQGMYRPSDYVSDFMSPYTTGVIEQVEKDIERQGNVARQRAAAQAVGRGAFGGSRQGIQAAEVERSIQDAKAKAAADLRARNYEQALAASQQAYQQGQTRDLEAGRLLGGLGQSVGQLGTAYGGLRKSVWLFSRHNRRYWSRLFSVTTCGSCVYDRRRRSRTCVSSTNDRYGKTRVSTPNRAGVATISICLRCAYRYTFGGNILTNSGRLCSSC